MWKKTWRSIKKILNWMSVIEHMISSLSIGAWSQWVQEAQWSWQRWKWLRSLDDQKVAANKSKHHTDQYKNNQERNNWS